MASSAGYAESSRLERTLPHAVIQQRDWKYFAGTNGGEHIAATEFVIGAAFVSMGACTRDLILGLVDMALLRFGRSSKAGFTSATGMIIGHWSGQMAAGVMGAGAAQPDDSLRGDPGDHHLDRLRRLRLGWAGDLTVAEQGCGRYRCRVKPQHGIRGY